MFAGLKNIFETFGAIADTVKKAFRNIFPPSTAEQLATFTSNFKSFTERIKEFVSSEPVKNGLKSIFSGMFSVLKLVIEGLKAFIKILKSVWDLLGPIRTAIYNATIALGDWLASLTDSVTRGEAFEKFYTKVKNIFEKISEVLSNVGDKIKKFFSSFKKKDTEEFVETTENIAEAIEPIEKVATSFDNTKNSIKDFTDKVIPKLKEFFGKAKEYIVNFFGGEINFDTVIHVIKEIMSLGIIKGLSKITNGLGGITEAIKGIFDGVAGATKKFEGIVGTINNIFIDLRTRIKEWKRDKTIDILKQIASALLKLAIALFIVSRIDTDKLLYSLGAITAMLGELAGTVAIITYILKGMSKGGLDPTSTNKLGIFMIEMSAAILIMAMALKKVSKIDVGKAWSSVLVMAALLGEVVLAMKYLTADTTVVTKGIRGVASIAIAVLALANSVKKLGKLDAPTLAKGLVGVLVLCTTLALTIHGLEGNISIGRGISFLIIAAGIIVLANAVEKLGSLPFPSLCVGLFGLISVLTALVIALKMMPTDVLEQAVSLSLVCVALIGVAQSLKMIGNLGWEQLIIGLLGIAGGLSAITIALLLLGNSGATILAGSAALLIASVALLAMAGSMKIISSMSWEDLGKALLGIIAILGILGLVSAILAGTGMVVAIAAVAGALLLLGVALLAIMAPLALFVSLMKAICDLGTAGVESLLTFLRALGSVIPEIAKQIGLGVIAFAESISTGGVAIISAISMILGAILTSMLENGPKIYEVICMLLDMVLDAILKYVPKIIEVGWTVLMSFLKGIRDNIEELVEVGVDIIVNFIKGIEESMPKLVDEAFNLILVFIDTLGTTIRDKTPILVDHVWEMAKNICIGLWEGLVHFVEQGKAKLKDFGNFIITTLEDVFGIPHGSIEKGASEFFDMAGQIVNGMIEGFKNGLKAIGKSVAEVGENIKQGFKDFFHIESPSKVMRDEVGTYISEGLAEGIEENDSPEEASEEKSKNVVETFKHLFDTGPGIGSNLSSGIASGLLENTAPEQAAKSKAQSIAEAFKKEIDAIDFSRKTNDLVTELWGANKSIEENRLYRLLDEEKSKEKPNELYIKELESKLNAISDERNLTTIEQTKGYISDLKEKERLNKEYYDKYVKEYGSDSKEAKEAWNSYVQSQIDTINKEEELKDLEYSYNKNKKEEAEKQRKENEELENSYYNWIIKNSDALREFGYSTEQIQKAATDATGFDPNKSFKKMENATKEATLDSMKAVNETYQENAENTFGELNGDFKSYGEQYGSNLAEGLDSKKSLIIKQSDLLSEGSLAALNDHTDEYYEAGKAAGQAYTEGLKQYSDTVLNDTTGLYSKDNDTLKALYSKKENEIKNKYKDVINQISNKEGVDTSTAYDMLRASVTKGASYGSGIIYDKTELEKEYKELESIYNGNGSISQILMDKNGNTSSIGYSTIKTSRSNSYAKSASFSIGSSSSNKSQNNSSSSGTTVNYTQNISSPKATSNSEIYRSTSTALSAIGSIVSSVSPIGNAITKLVGAVAQS